MGKRSEMKQHLYAETLCTAVEGGINYWAQVSDYEWEADDSYRTTYASATVYDMGHTNQHYKVNVDTIAKGVNAVLAGKSKYLSDGYIRRVRKYFSDEDAFDVDSAMADTILQMGIFGEVIFG